MKKKIIKNIRIKRWVYYLVAYILVLPLIALFSVVNRYAQENFIDFFISVIGGIELLIFISIVLFNIGFVKMFIISKYLKDLQNKCKWQEYCYAVEYIYQTSKGSTMKEVVVEQYLFALQLEDQLDKIQNLINENKEMLKTKKPIKYYNMQAQIAKQLGNQDTYIEYSQLAEVLIEEKINKPKNDKEAEKYQEIYVDFLRGKNMFYGEYLKVIDSYNNLNTESRLDKVLKNITLAECYAHLGNIEEKNKCLSLCKKYGNNIPMIQRRIEMIEENLI